MKTKTLVTVYTDGACKGNPGPGGWGVVLQWRDQTHELFGGESMTTNNRMELRAAIESLSILTRECEVDMYVDSQYVIQGAKGWINAWRKNGWKTRQDQPVKNADLWMALDPLLRLHKVRWHWVKGHNGNPGNERADQLANLGVNQGRGK